MPLKFEDWAEMAAMTNESYQQMRRAAEKRKDAMRNAKAPAPMPVAVTKFGHAEDQGE
jgi:hypothetical protein